MSMENHYKTNIRFICILDRPSVIEDEMFRLSTEALGSEQDANFVIKELLPALSTDGIDQALQIILENYEKFKKEENQ